MDNRPGLDDGSSDMATSIAMARLAAAVGISTVIGTPHWIEDEHETDPVQVRQIARDLQVELNSCAIPLTVLPGNEGLICPDVPDLVKRGDVLTLADRGTHLLLELPYEACRPTWTSSSVCSCRASRLSSPTSSATSTSAAIGTSWTAGSSVAALPRSMHRASTVPEATTSYRTRWIVGL